MIKMLTLLKEIENATKLNGRKELNKEKRKKKHAVKTCSSLCGENLGEEIHAPTVAVLLGGGRGRGRVDGAGGCCLLFSH